MSTAPEAASRRVAVAVRLRPRIAEDGPAEPVARTSANTVILGERGTFGPFDHCFAASASNAAVYDSCAAHVVAGVVAGETNGTVLTYGQTGSGKTHTVGAGSGDGIVPRALSQIFEAVAADRGQHTFAVYLSCMQLYLENVEDLLNPNGTGSIKIREDASDPWGLVLVDGLVRIPLTSLEQALQLTRAADAQRAVAATQMNWASSRSHACYSLFVERTPVAAVAAAGTPQAAAASTAAALALIASSNASQVTTRTKLHILDLAGSERVKKTGVLAGTSMADEARATNLSLLALGKVIHSLAEGKEHVPFREVKLTVRTLRSSFTPL